MKIPIVLSVTAVLSVMLITATGCHPAYKAIAGTAQVERALCGEEWLLFPDQPHPVFEEVQGVLTDVPAGFIIPKKYIRYRVSADTLNAFFTYPGTGGKKKGIILPVERHCEAFELQSSGAMSPALQEKYPQLVSLQGRGRSNKADDVRLDWDGRQLRGQITYNGSVYFIAPVMNNKELTYVFYNRADTGEEKQPFETRPAESSKKVYYDR